MSKDLFLGSWRLISNKFQYKNGKVIYPLGKDSMGLLIYQPDHMAVQIMNPERKNFASLSQYKGTDSEIRPAFEGYMAYFGKYDIDEDKKIIYHHLEASIFPNWIGGDQVRHYKFSENNTRLSLKTEPIEAKTGTVTGYLFWQRA
jgi:hypothetical protein